jgi:UV excision repair protein RAD23
MINQNQQEFLRLLEEDAGDAPAGNVIQVTAEERDSIQRLEALGFSRARVLEAFLACDRNEELAANYLFEHGNEED